MKFDTAWSRDEVLVSVVRNVSLSIFIYALLSRGLF